VCTSTSTRTTTKPWSLELDQRNDLDLGHAILRWGLTSLQLWDPIAQCIDVVFTVLSYVRIRIKECTHGDNMARWLSPNFGPNIGLSSIKRLTKCTEPCGLIGYHIHIMGVNCSDGIVWSRL
jgi:hypothetical protein